jgi:hypothetical protein
MPARASFRSVQAQLPNRTVRGDVRLGASIWPHLGASIWPLLLSSALSLTQSLPPSVLHSSSGRSVFFSVPVTVSSCSRVKDARKSTRRQAPGCAFVRSFSWRGERTRTEGRREGEQRDANFYSGGDGDGDGVWYRSVRRSVSRLANKPQVPIRGAGSRGAMILAARDPIRTGRPAGRPITTSGLPIRRVLSFHAPFYLSICHVPLEQQRLVLSS